MHPFRSPKSLGYFFLLFLVFNLISTIRVLIHRSPIPLDPEILKADIDLIKERTYEIIITDSSSEEILGVHLRENYHHGVFADDFYVFVNRSFGKLDSALLPENLAWTVHGKAHPVITCKDGRKYALDLSRKGSVEELLKISRGDWSYYNGLELGEINSDVDRLTVHSPFVESDSGPSCEVVRISTKRNANPGKGGIQESPKKAFKYEHQDCGIEIIVDLSEKTPSSNYYAQIHNLVPCLWRSKNEKQLNALIANKSEKYLRVAMLRGVVESGNPKSMDLQDLGALLIEISPDVIFFHPSVFLEKENVESIPPEDEIFLNYLAKEGKYVRFGKHMKKTRAIYLIRATSESDLMKNILPVLPFNAKVPIPVYIHEATGQQIALMGPGGINFLDDIKVGPNERPSVMGFKEIIKANNAFYLSSPTDTLHGRLFYEKEGSNSTNQIYAIPRLIDVDDCQSKRLAIYYYELDNAPKSKETCKLIRLPVRPEDLGNVGGEYFDAENVSMGKGLRWGIGVLIIIIILVIAIVAVIRRKSLFKVRKPEIGKNANSI